MRYYDSDIIFEWWIMFGFLVILDSIFFIIGL